MSAEFAPSGLQAARPSVNPWLIAATVMSATFMEVLDTSIANVALPHIAGSLAASTDESTWVLTSYLVSNAIVLVATGWLSGFFGRKRLLLSCIVIFTAASALCGAAPSLSFLIIARVIQGAGGGVLQPTAQAVLLESFPAEKRGQAMAVYTMGVVVAPIVGPTVGGWITDNYTWRWTFYINLPVGVFATLMTQAFITDPPYLRRVRGRIDYIGFALMAAGLASLQIVLDKGQQDDWFSSALIRYGTVVAVVGLTGFILWELRVESPIVDLRVMKNRNFALGTLLVTAVGVTLYATITLLPLFLQTVLGYTATLSGETLTPRGIGALVATIIVGRLIGKIDTRLMMVFGFGLLALSVYMLGDVDLEVAKSTFLWPNIINGFAIGLIFTPLTTTAVSTLRTAQLSNATGIFNLMRNLGGSIGISAVTTFLARREQWHQTVLASHLTRYDRIFRQRFRRAEPFLGRRRPYGLLAGTETFFKQTQGAPGRQRAYGVFYGRLLNQAALLAFIDNFRALTLLCLLCAPLALFFKKAEVRGGPPIAH
jgi:DHA2 family multidrug resistance protein